MNLSPYVCWVSGLTPTIRAGTPHPLTIRRAQALAVAAHLPALLWAVTTLVIAQFLFGMQWGRSAVLAVFAGVVIFYVERLVILSPPTRLSVMTRIGLGLVVAILGATCTDIVLFDKEIKAQLGQEAKAQAVSVLEGEALKMKEEVSAARSRWLVAQGKAQCEADGTCGSRKPNIGPVYKELARHADALGSQYASLEKQLRDLEGTRLAAAQSALKISDDTPGLLARVSALYRFVLSDLHAFAIYALFLLFICLIEAMTVLTKLAFPRTVDDEIEAANAAVSSHAAARYIELMNTEPGRTRLLVNSTYSS